MIHTSLSAILRILFHCCFERLRPCIYMREGEEQRESESERKREREAWLHLRNSNIYLSTTWHSVRRLGLQLQPLLAIFTPSSYCTAIFSDMQVYGSHYVMTEHSVRRNRIGRNHDSWGFLHGLFLNVSQTRHMFRHMFSAYWPSHHYASVYRWYSGKLLERIN